MAALVDYCVNDFKDEKCFKNIYSAVVVFVVEKHIAKNPIPAATITYEQDPVIEEGSGDCLIFLQ